MKGSYWFKAKSKKVLFEFSIRRNITVIKGDSATGKTTLLHILYEYLRIGSSQDMLFLQMHHIMYIFEMKWDVIGKMHYIR